MRYTLRPTVFPTIVAIILIALFVWLGFWQLDRAQYKERLWAQFNRADSGELVRIDTTAGLTGLERYTPVRLRGHYDEQHQILLDNRIHEGRAGVHVYTPLRLSGGVVLVNRGWLPLPPARRPLPAAPAPGGEVTVQGLISPPPPAGLVLGEVQAPETWPWLTPYLMLDRVQTALAHPVAERVILLSPQAPHGFVRNWAPDTLPPARHTGYAVQWFALALAMFVVWVVVNFRKAGDARSKA